MNHRSKRTVSIAQRAFTLTEIMIALAMVALLLVGISRIFAMTSATISTGQALSKAVRAQRAVQQTLAADFIGTGPVAGNIDTHTGMVPLGGGAGVSAPMLILSSFRVAAYANDAEARGDVNPPVAGDTFQVRSAKIRGIDLNNDGDDADAGETISIYNTGLRNYRVDSIGFFTQGKFTSQTGTTINTGNANYDFSSFQNGATSAHAYTWYGHLAVFNGDVARIPWQNAFGLPGMELTMNSTAGTPNPKGPQPNRNNVFANDFLLGRFQMLMREPTNHDNNTATEETVTTDDLTPVAHVIRSWNGPRSPSDGTTRAPMSYGSAVRVFNYAANPRENYSLGQNDVLYRKSTPPTEPVLEIQTARSDIAAAGLNQYYERLAFLGGETFVTSGQTQDVRDRWWADMMGARFTNRFQINPFAREATGNPYSARTFSQRSQLLSAGCTQFIVEYAGDFLTQNGDGVVQVPATPPVTIPPQPPVTDHSFNPDGVIDFTVINGRRLTRWYGMPRDVDGNGAIAGNTGTTPPGANSPIYDSIDVIPLRDMTGGPLEVRLPASPSDEVRSFETVCPIAQADYAKVFDEVSNTTNASTLTNTVILFAAIDPEDSGYVCAWNPVDFETQKTVTVGTTSRQVRPVPQLIRVIVDMTDTEGKLTEPLRQEYVFPVPVSK